MHGRLGLHLAWLGHWVIAGGGLGGLGVRCVWVGLLLIRIKTCLHSFFQGVFCH